jgi:hypothetical protein
MLLGASSDHARDRKHDSAAGNGDRRMLTIVEIEIEIVAVT